MWYYRFKYGKRLTYLHIAYVRDSLSIAKCQKLSSFIQANCHTQDRTSKLTAVHSR